MATHLKVMLMVFVTAVLVLMLVEDSHQQYTYIGGRRFYDPYWCYKRRPFPITPTRPWIGYQRPPIYYIQPQPQPQPYQGCIPRYYGGGYGGSYGGGYGGSYGGGYGGIYPYQSAQAGQAYIQQQPQYAAEAPGPAVQPAGLDSFPQIESQTAASPILAYDSDMGSIGGEVQPQVEPQGFDQGQAQVQGSLPIPYAQGGGGLGGQNSILPYTPVTGSQGETIGQGRYFTVPGQQGGGGGGSEFSTLPYYGDQFGGGAGQGQGGQGGYIQPYPGPEQGQGSHGGYIQPYPYTQPQTQPVPQFG